MGWDYRGVDMPLFWEGQQGPWDLLCRVWLRSKEGPERLGAVRRVGSH